MTEKKVDLWNSLLPLLDSGDLTLISNLDDDYVKAASPLIAMKAMSGVSGSRGPYAILATNEVANKGFWKLSKHHPKLQLMLLALCTTNDRGKVYHYFPGSYKKDIIRETIQSWYPTWKQDEITMLLEISSKEDLIQMAMDRGLQDKELSKWIKELRST